MSTHRRNFLVFLFSASSGSFAAKVHAGGGVCAEGCATEATQYANLGVLTSQYATQIKEYQKQIQQHITQVDMLRTMAINLLNNPLSVIDPEVSKIISDVGKIMSAGKAIGSTLAKVGDNFNKKYRTKIGSTLTENFKIWHETSSDTLDNMMQASALHRERFESEADKLKALYVQSQKTEGNLQALQTLSKISIDQSQKLQQLGDLVASANLAVGTALASQTARDQAKQEAGEINFKPFQPPAKSTYKTPAL